MSLEYQTLARAIASNAAAFRCRRTLQPAGGAGTKIFPPTFAGAVYSTERRAVPGKPNEFLNCVVLDSVQSQANRMEEALQQALDAGKLKLPLVEVDFSGADLVEPVGKISSLQAPHRIADAILRDSDLNGTKFRMSEVGKAIDSASAANATPLYALNPTSLILGMWDSTGPKGGLGVKFERAIVSEVVGVGTPYNFSPNEEKDTANPSPKNRGVRRDPLQASKSVLVKGTPMDWKVVGDKEAKGAIRPSELNHGSVPFESDNAGVTIDHAEQSIVLSLIALRRLAFPVNGKTTAEINSAGQTVLAALALCAATLSAEKGMDLRSRCVLWPDAPMEWELLAVPGKTPEKFSLSGDESIQLLVEAVAAAEKLGLKWISEPVRLTPSKPLVDLVRKSQEAMQRGEAQE